MKTTFALVGFCFLLTTTTHAQMSTGFQEVTPEEAGISQDSLDVLDDLIYNTPPRDFRGLIVIKDNQLAVEYYYHTFWRNTIHDIRSAGKSVTALLLGVAIQQGLISSLDQDVYSFFPKDQYPDINPDYQQITLRHLLNMASGLDADSDYVQTPGHAGQWMSKEDWLPYLLQVPTVRPPGQKWVYADIHAVLIGAIIEQTSGMHLNDFAKQYLFDPMGIDQWYWYTNKSGQTGAAGNLYLTALDFAKLGTLLLNEGQWMGKPLVDAAYVDELISTTAHELPEDWTMADTYGFLWYKSERTIGDKTYRYVWASGNGGNHLVVFPEENMVIALTASAYGPGPGHRRSFNIMSKVLLAMQ
ncbi:MAG: serine hydrolase [Bacteroidota bacterium]